MQAKAERNIARLSCRFRPWVHVRAMDRGARRFHVGARPAYEARLEALGKPVPSPMVLARH